MCFDFDFCAAKSYRDSIDERKTKHKKIIYFIMYNKNSVFKIQFVYRIGYNISKIYIIMIII